MLTLAFSRVAASGSFIEALAPEFVLDKVAQYDSLENRRHIVTISFPDDREVEDAILGAVSSVATAHGLEPKSTSPRLIGRLAEWAREPLSLEIQRYDSIGQIAVTLEDFGDRELSGAIAREIVRLPNVKSTQRFVSINLRSETENIASVTEAVAAAAEKFNLTKIDGREMFSLASYERDGLTLRLSLFDGEGKLQIAIEDTGWTPDFYNLEATLRIALLPDASQGSDGS